MNKIWNAFRFISPFLGEKEVDLDFKNISVQEKWILGELNRTIQSVNKSMDEYRFDDACSAIYSFIYDQFCSWFIELSKPLLYGKNSAKKLQRIQVLRLSFREVLKLLHPMAPFLTEELWSQFNSTLLINETFPEENTKWNFPFEQTHMNHFTEIVTNIRNLKISLQLSPKEKIKAHFFTDDKFFAEFLFENRLELKKLVNIFGGTVEKRSAARPDKSIMAATSVCEVYIPAEHLIDIPKEVQRLKNQLLKIEDELLKVQSKLNNQQFVSRAPQHVIDEVKEKIDNYSSQKVSLQESLKRLGAS